MTDRWSLRPRHILLAALVVLAVPWPALAFRGRIVDLQGQPIPNVEVYVLGRPGEAITDADGRFEWKPDPAPPFEILVVVPGGSYMQPVLIEALDPAGELTVIVTPIVSEVVTVSGSAPGIESTPAAGTTTLTGAELAVRQPANLMQALENVAGVNQVSEGQSAAPAVRGLARGRTLVLIDGARVTSERRVGPSASYIDPVVIESIDVSRGPGSVAYGSDAFGGVIAVRTHRVRRNAPWAVEFTGNLGVGVPESRAAVAVSKGFAEGGILMAVHIRHADDWESPEGAVFNSGFSDNGVLVRGQHQLGRGVFTAGWQSDFGREIERPRDNSRTVRFSYPAENSHRFTSNYEVREVGGWQRVGVDAFLGAYDQVTDQDRFATATSPRHIDRADVSANDFGVRSFGERLSGRARVELGVDVNGRFGLHALEIQESYDLSGALAGSTTNVSILTAQRIDSGLYASVDTTIVPALSMSGGVRGDVVTTENSGGSFGSRSTSNGAASGFLALTAGSFGGWSATVQAARGFRDPTLSDRYYQGPSGRGFITGNPDLDPETSLQYDLAIRYVAARFRMAAFYYQYRIDNLIERYEAQPDSFFFRNRGRARLRGFELEAQADLGGGTTLEVAHQLTDGRALDDGTHLDDISPLTLSVQLRKQFATRGFAQVRTAFFAEDNEPGPTERAVPGYTLLDLSAGYTVAPPLEVRVLARNILNATYFAGQDTRAVFAPGRSASVAVTVKF